MATLSLLRVGGPAHQPQQQLQQQQWATLLLGTGAAAAALLLQYYYSTSLSSRRPWPKVPGAWPLIGNWLGWNGIDHYTYQLEEWVVRYGGCHDEEEERDEEEMEDYENVHKKDTSRRPSSSNNNKNNNPTGLLEVNLLGQRMLLVCHNRVGRQLAALRPHIVQRKPELNAAVNSTGAVGVFTAEGTQWQRDRRLTAPPLNRQHIARDYMPSIRLVTERLLAEWERQRRQDCDGSIAINQDLTSYTIDNIGLIAFDKDFHCLGQQQQESTAHHIGQDLQRLFHKAAFRTLSPIPYWRIPLIGQHLDGVGRPKQRLLQRLNDIVNEYEERENGAANVKTVKNNPSNKKKATFLSKVLQSQNDDKDGPEENPKVRRERILGNLLTMFAAGSESTGSTIMTSLWEVLNYETSHVKNDNDTTNTTTTTLYDELVHEALAVPDLESNATPLPTLLAALPKLRAVFYEVVRWNGAAPLLLLHTAQPVTLQQSSSAGESTTLLPAGQDLILPLRYLGTQRDSGVPLGPNGESPQCFCPYRWLLAKKSKGNDDDEDEKKISNGNDDDDNNNNNNNNSNDTTTKWTVQKPGAKTGVPLSGGFGTGLRICPGQDLAEVEAVYCMAALLRRFDIRLAPNHAPMKLVARTSMTPNIDIRVVLTPRATTTTTTTSSGSNDQ